MSLGKAQDSSEPQSSLCSEGLGWEFPTTPLL